MRDRLPDYLKIYGVSHLVLATSNTERASDFLSNFSYRNLFYNVKNRNPKEKELFIKGPLAKSTTATLMTVANNWPPFELLKENYNQTGSAMNMSPSTICALIEVDEGHHDESTIQKIVNFQDRDDPIMNFYGINNKMSTDKTLALAIPCYDLNDALEFWEFIGFNPYIENNLARISIKKTIVGRSLSLYFLTQTRRTPKMWLNQEGIVCISFLCSDAKKIRDELELKGYEVGECFKLKPFNRALKIFFMRNHSGEIYEFLSSN